MTCAICVSTVGPFTSQPLGKDGALVKVCFACDAPIFASTGPDRGWQPSGGLLDHDKLTVAMRRVMGDDEYERLNKIEDEFSRAAGVVASEDDKRFRDYLHENKKRHYSRAQYQNRTNAEKAKK